MIGRRVIETNRAFTLEELKWEYNSATKTVVISGKGPMKNYADIVGDRGL